MPIDWFTVCAQLINFAILLFFLRRFLFVPLLEAVEKRETLIEEQLKEASHSRDEAKKEKENFENKNRDFDQQKKTLLQALDEECRLQRGRLLHEQREEYLRVEKSQREKWKREWEELSTKLHLSTQKELLSIVRKALGDLASVRLEEFIVTKFLHQLESIPEQKRIPFQEKKLLLRTSFELDSVLKKNLEEKIQNFFQAQVEFQEKSELVCGLELSHETYKIAWNLDEYMDALRDKLKSQWERS